MAMLEIRSLADSLADCPVVSRSDCSHRRPSLELTKEPAPRLIYSFGAFQLDPTERRLVCDGREVRLPPKVFELLVILVERHGLLVEKDDLMKALWPDMFVEEITLTGNVSRLRKALGDAPGQDESQYIETVSKRGYRFIANVTEVAQPAASSGGLQEPEALSVSQGTLSGWWQNRRAWMTGSPAATGRGSRAVRFAWGAAGVLLGALVAMGIVYIKLKNAASADTVVRSTILPPSGSKFADILDEPLGAPAISPDGKQLVSPVKDSRGNSFLWLRSLNESGEGRRLPGTEGGGYIAVVPPLSNRVTSRSPPIYTCAWTCAVCCESVNDDCLAVVRLSFRNLAAFSVF
jgi:DNA-binding winged helix-turn-helix (wHTH) protein